MAMRRGPKAGWDQFPNFDKSEFACICCGRELPFGTIYPMASCLQDLRTTCGFPFLISNAFRCKKHPIEIAKIAPGPHSTGLAVDIVCSHRHARTLIDEAVKQGCWTGIGIKQHGDVETRFVHLDMCEAIPGRPRPHIWSYP